MKSIIAVGLLISSFSAFSATEFVLKTGKSECTISNDKVTHKLTFQKGIVGYTKTTTIKTFGTEELVAKAIDASSGRTTAQVGMEFFVKTDGKAVTLFADDSKEALALIQFINSACN